MASAFPVKARSSQAMPLNRKPWRRCYRAYLVNSVSVILDACIASEENIQYLIEHHYKYIVVSRKRKRDFDEDKATVVKDTPGQTVKAQRVVVEEIGEIELYCHSELREKKEQAMQDSFAEKYEWALSSLHNGLSKKGCTKKYIKVLERIGRLNEKYAPAAQHYDVTVTADKVQLNALSIEWKWVEKSNSQATLPGVYCLRSNLTDWDEETPSAASTRYSSS
jgi:glycerol-3-phosphate cytidylyltransferase-like family protein